MTARTMSYDDLLRVGPLRLVIRRHWDRDGWALYLAVLEHDPAKGYYRRALRVESMVVHPDDGMLPPQAPMFLPKEFGGVQDLMDDLWREGLRPSFKMDLTRAEEHLAHVTRLLDQVLPKALRPDVPARAGGE